MLLVRQVFGKKLTIQGPSFRSANLPVYLSWARYDAFQHCDHVM